MTIILRIARRLGLEIHVSVRRVNLSRRGKVLCYRRSGDCHGVL